MDCLAEYEHERSIARKQRIRLVNDLVALRQEAQTAFPVLAVLATPSTTPSVKTHYSLSRFDGLVEAVLGGGGESAQEGDPHHSASGETLADVLWIVVDQLLPTLGVAADDGHLVDLRDRLAALRDEFTRARRSQSLMEQVSPAAKWFWLRKIVTDSNPSPVSVEWLVAHAGDCEPYRPYFRFLYEPASVSTEDRAWLEGFRPQVSATVVAIRSEFEMRLGTRASAAWALQRYARRCRWLRLDEMGTKLASRAAEQRRQKEVTLTRDAAVFLYDQGFDVVVEQSHGQHRYDILAPSLLVEAKVYSAKRRPLDAVVDGLKQVQQYATALASEGPAPEPILILFRLDGPVADPLEEYTIGNLRVSIVWVDLGPATESGSQASAPDLSVTREGIDRKLTLRRSRRGQRSHG